MRLIGAIAIALVPQPGWRKARQSPLTRGRERDT
jgi:hypothetical protein